MLTFLLLGYVSVNDFCQPHEFKLKIEIEFMLYQYFINSKSHVDNKCELNSTTIPSILPCVVLCVYHR